MGEEEADKNQEPVKNAPKDGKDVPISFEEKRVIFGQRLRTTREQLNQTKKDVIHLTRISPPFIDALEEGNFDALPGEVFGRGFVKNICKVFEIDSASLLEEYNQCWEHKQVKARSYGYSRRLSNSRKDHKSKKSLPFTNYFSPKGVLLWVLGPVVVLGIVLLVFFKTGYLDSNSSRNKPGLQERDINKSQISTEAEESKPGKKLASAEEAIQSKDSPETLAEISSPNSIANGLESKSFNSLKANEQKTEQVPPAPVPKKPTPVIEVAPKGLSFGSKGQKSSYLMVFVKQDTTIKHRFDQDSYQTKEYRKGLYKFKFKDKIDLFCEDMSKLEITFNGRKLGDFGINRDAKQLSFIGNPAVKKKS